MGTRILYKFLVSPLNVCHHCLVHVGIHSHKLVTRNLYRIRVPILSSNKYVSMFISLYLMSSLQCLGGI